MKRQKSKIKNQQGFALTAAVIASIGAVVIGSICLTAGKQIYQNQVLEPVNETLTEMLSIEADGEVEAVMLTSNQFRGSGDITIQSSGRVKSTSSLKIDGVSVLSGFVVDDENDTVTLSESLLRTLGLGYHTVTIETEGRKSSVQTIKVCGFALSNGETLLWNDTSLKMYYTRNDLRTQYGSLITRIVMPDDLTYTDSWQFEGCSNLEEVDIGGVTKIGTSSLRSNSALTSIDLTNVTEIGAWSFNNTPLKEITYSAKLKTVGREALASTKIDTWNFIGSIDEYVVSPVTTHFYGNRNKTNLYINGEQVTSVEISEATSVGCYAFQGCQTLTDVTLGEQVVSIGANAFYNCKGITSIEIPNGVKTIGMNAFDGCSSLTDVTIGSGIETISVRAFDNLQNATIHFNCDDFTFNNTSIYANPIFLNCKNITLDFSNYTGSEAPVIGEKIKGLFYNTSIKQIVVPVDMVDTFKNASGWSGYSKYIVAAS